MPPNATASTCAPRQMPSTAPADVVGDVHARDLGAVAAGVDAHEHVGRGLAVGGRIDVAATAHEERVRLATASSSGAVVLVRAGGEEHRECAHGEQRVDVAAVDRVALVGLAADEHGDDRRCGSRDVQS